MLIIASHSPLNISDKYLVTKDHQWEMAYGESNNHNSQDR